MSLENVIAEFAENNPVSIGSTNIEGKGIIVLALPYEYDLAPRLPGLRGRISIAAVGQDYHERIAVYLNKLAQNCKLIKPALNITAYADTGPLLERPLAVSAGLGYIGKNNLLHTKKFGSMVFLGYLMLDIPLEATTKPDYSLFENSCNNCSRCINACPTAALSENGFEKEKCISFLTQKKGILSQKEMQTMGKQIYGCDCCQLSCPHNLWDKTPGDSLKQYPLLSSLLDMDKAVFGGSLRTTAAGWQGRNAIRKNALIAIGNARASESLALLLKAASDPSPLISKTAKQILNFY